MSKAGLLGGVFCSLFGAGEEKANDIIICAKRITLSLGTKRQLAKDIIEGAQHPLPIPSEMLLKT
jgi:hypothetical protein